MAESAIYANHAKRKKCLSSGTRDQVHSTSLRGIAIRIQIINVTSSQNGTDIGFRD